MAKRGGFPGGMPGNMNNLMKQAQRMQRQMEEAQKAMEEMEVTATAGGGAVEVTVSGKKEVLKVKLAEEVVDPEDIEMLEDLIVAATNEALRKIDDASQQSMSKITGEEMEISLQAGELVGKLYDALLKQYNTPASDAELKSLNMLCVRLVFCLYAEDAGIFGSHTMFHDYLKGFQAKNVRKALIDLFKVLDTKVADRDPYMDEDLAAFPYVNGGLFADEEIIIPRFTEEIIDLLLTM